MSADTRDAARCARDRVLQLVRTLGHDLTGPARRIASFARILGQDIEDEADHAVVKDSLKHLQRESSRMLDLVEGLRSYARIALDEPGPRQPCELRSLIDAAEAELEQELDQAGIVLRVETADRWDVHPELIRLALTHLIRNAIQHGGSDCTTIAVATRIEGDQLQLTVEDNGAGPRGASLEDLFGPFYTTADGGAGGGQALGLGLAYCQLVADHHGGDVSAERRTQGFRVVLRLGDAGRTPGSESLAELGEMLGR